jgi:hypothetical protein
MDNKYDEASVHNVKITRQKGKVLGVHADYTYNKGQPGWVDVDLRPKIPCLSYWDMNGCRPMNVSRQEEFAAAMQEAERNQARVRARQKNNTSDNCNNSLILFGAGFDAFSSLTASGCW